LGEPLAGNVGMVCLRLAASGNTKGPFCPHAYKATDAQTISPARSEHFMT
jgi:hypothetical protein